MSSIHSYTSSTPAFITDLGVRVQTWQKDTARETETSATRTCMPVRALTHGSWVAAAGWVAGWPAAALRSCREVQSKYRIKRLPHSKLTALANDISHDWMALCRFLGCGGLAMPSRAYADSLRTTGRVSRTTRSRYPRRAAAPGSARGFICNASQQTMDCRSCLAACTAWLQTRESVWSCDRRPDSGLSRIAELRTT